MQSAISLLTQQLAEVKNKFSDNTPSSNNQFKNLPQTVAAALGSSLLAEHCGFKAVGSSSHQLAVSCYGVAEAMQQDAVIINPNGQTLSKLDYYQAAAGLSPTTKAYWLKLAENLGDDEKIKVGQQTYSKEECLSRGASLPAMALHLKQARQIQQSSHQSGCAEYLHDRPLEHKQSHQSKH